MERRPAKRWIMKTMRGSIVAGLVAGCAGLAFALVACAPDGTSAPGPSAVTAKSVVATSMPVPVIRLYTLPDFKGSEGVASSVLAEKLNEFTWDHQGAFSGVWPTNKGTLVVGVARPDDPAVAQLDALRNKLDPGLKISRTVPAKYSYTQLDAIREGILASTTAGKYADINGWGPNPTDEAVHVEIFRTDKDPTLQQNATVKELVKTYGDAVEFSESSGRNSAATG